MSRRQQQRGSTMTWIFWALGYAFMVGLVLLFMAGATRLDDDSWDEG